MPKKVLNGVVVSDKMQNTIVVQVVRTYMHDKYKKTVRTRKKFVVHDANNAFKNGDNVTFIESRPISKTKCWIVMEK